MLQVKQIEEKIKDIHNDLVEKLDKVESISMFGGVSGMLVFYHLLYKLKKEEKYKKIFYNIVENVYERLSSEEYSGTYCDGLTGVAFTIEFFRKNGMLLDEDVAETMEMFDNLILENLKECSHEKGEYDFLHGIMGDLYYLNERVKTNPSIKNELIIQFEKMATIIQKEIETIPKTTEEIPQPNCGLAHGNMSTIIVFAKILANFPENKIVKEFLPKIIYHQLGFKSKDESTLSLFPSIARLNNTEQYDTVLGWCYGDQTVALGLYQAGTILKDKEILDHAYKIAQHTAKRNNAILSSKTEVTDAGLCHGMSSVALNNRLLYDWTGEKVFLENYHFFVDKVLERGNNKETPSGFRRYYGDDDYQDIIGFLDGTIGIGVFLISTLLKEETEWERFFLLK